MNKDRKKIQLCRNDSIFKDLSSILDIWRTATNIGLNDGEQVIGRYHDKSGKIHTIYGIAHVNKKVTPLIDYIEIFYNKHELENTINSKIPTDNKNLKNGAGYQNETQVNTTIENILLEKNYATNARVDDVENIKEVENSVSGNLMVGSVMDMLAFV